MAHIMEYKITFELDNDKMFESYAEEWVNNNHYARYRIIDEEFIKGYWTEEEKQNIEDTLIKVMETEEFKVYETKYGLIYIADKENKVRFAYNLDVDKVLYARSVKTKDILQWIELCKELAGNGAMENVANRKSKVKVIVENTKATRSVQNVAATMAVDGMYLSEEFVIELIKVAKGEKSSEELRQEVIKKYTR